MHSNDNDDIGIKSESEAEPETAKFLDSIAHATETATSHNWKWPRRSIAIVLLLGLCIRYFNLTSSWSVLHSPTSPDLPPSVFRHLAQYSPYFPVAEYTPPPAHCIIDQVSILQRHGSRWPTRGAAKIIRQTLAKLQNASFGRGHLDEDVEFLKRYRYQLGEEDLVPLGVQEAYQAAQEAFNRYAHLSKEKGVFVRSSSSERVQTSARHWVKAFIKAAADAGSTLHIYDLLVISDAPGSNDTLANNGCPNFQALHRHWEWADVFTPPIQARLQAKLGNEVKLNSHDIIVLFGLCAFESVARQATSPFCGLFTHNEFLDFEYFQDLEKYYNRGYGNDLGPVQGVGYVNELLARLTGKPVQDATQTNKTMDDDAATFPLDKGVYADFTHDNTIAAIVSALGLFRDTTPLPANKRPLDRLWRFGHIAPFAGRIVFERLNCDGVPSIRILADDALQMMSFCSEGEAQICTLSALIASQSFASQNGQGRWQECGWRPADSDGWEQDAQHDAIAG